MGVLETIKNGFRWIFLDKESNTWKEYCKNNGLVKEEPKEKIKTIVLEKVTDKKETEKPVEEEVKLEPNVFFPEPSNKEKIERCKQIICNYMYDCNESKTAVADLLGNNRNEWYIVSDGLNGRSKLITESLEYLTKKKWEFLGEVESSVYGWRVDYSKMLDKEYEKNI
jgi:hypothetical protein